MEFGVQFFPDVRPQEKSSAGYFSDVVDEAPDRPHWPPKIKFDDYRMHARLDRSAVRY
jgi:hypothetical protein